MSKYQVWSEGYAATGEHGEAQLIGTAEANSFDEAVVIVNERENPDGRRYGNLNHNLTTGKWSLWGCTLFDNESDARRNFG